MSKTQKVKVGQIRRWKIPFSAESDNILVTEIGEAAYSKWVEFIMNEEKYRFSESTIERDTVNIKTN